MIGSSLHFKDLDIPYRKPLAQWHWNDQLLCVRGGPEQSEGGREGNVTILLPDNFYSNKEKRCIPESETQLQANYKRVGPAIMAGFKEAHERGWLPNITFNIDIRDTFCSNIYAPKVVSSRELITLCVLRRLVGKSVRRAIRLSVRQILQRRCCGILLY